MNNDYYKYKKYKQLYKKQKITVGGTNNCNDIIKSKNETFQAWKTRCRINQLCVINNKSRKCQVNPNNITININEMTGESYPVMINSPYTVAVLFRMLSQEKRRCKLFRVGAEEALPMDEDLEDGEVIFLLPKPPVTPIMDWTALRMLVKSWCQGGFTEDEELLETYGHISDWDVGNVTDMGVLFRGASSFNQPLNGWDVSNVTNMSYMFFNASSFNQPLVSWNVSNVTNMEIMFHNSSSFNQPLNSWNVSNVTNMDHMFYNANSFNQSLYRWNVSNVTNMLLMFNRARMFNQPLGSWNVGNVTNMESMFGVASSFNQPLDNWNVGNVTNMESMFNMASSFNQSLHSWNVGNVTNMNSMFYNADNFDPNNAPWYNL